MMKRWKLTDEDWRNREKNRDYEAAAEEMFERTSHALAPWDVIAAEQKRYARIAWTTRRSGGGAMSCRPS